MKRNRILYLCLFLLALSFVYFYGGKMPYMLFHLVLVLPVISLAYTVVVYFRFKYHQDTDKKMAIKGEKVNFIFSISNEDFFIFPYLKVNFCGAETIFSDQFQVRTLSIAPFGSKRYSFELQCKYRGSYDIGIRTVEIEDFLGIFKLTYRIPEPKYITVYPRIVQLDRFSLKTDYLSESHSVLQSRNEDMSSISEIRQYSYGDTLKKIHWKLTAKTGELKVKRFQSTSETSTILVLDLKRNPFTFEQNTIIEDKMIETAVAVLNYCLQSWIPVKLVYFNEKLVELEAKNPLYFNEVYKALARLKFEGSINVEDILDIYLRDSINKTNVIVFTPSLNYDLYDEIYRASAAGYDISLIYVSPEEVTGVKTPDEGNILSFLPEIGVSTYKVNINDDTKSILEGGGAA